MFALFALWSLFCCGRLFPVNRMPVVQFFNTLSREIEGFVPRQEGRVAMYVCGSTVYAPPHLGHARMAVVFDMIRKYFEFAGYDVTFVSNFTDVDDKIIARAQEQGIPAAAVAEKNITIWEENMRRLGVALPDIAPKATAHIPEMLEMIRVLIEKEYAYVVDGDVYFRVDAIPSYGRLSGQKLEDLQVGARVLPGEKKKSPFDFVLWKAAKPGEPSWDSPWGAGRPGWHIECSAMGVHYLGMGFDIHGGGSDLIFPHHENEIAQAEACMQSEPFARYWVHNGLVKLDGEKMAKSTGNFVSVSELLQEHTSQAVRLLVAQTHYRKALDFSSSLIAEAETAVERLGLCRDRLVAAGAGMPASAIQGTSLYEEVSADEKAMSAFRAAMENDFATPGAVAALFELVKRANTLLEAQDHDLEALAGAARAISEIDRVLGVVPPAKHSEGDTALLPELMQLLLDVREQARAQRDFDLSDLIRDRLDEVGIIVEDTPQGTRWRARRRQTPGL